MARIGDPAASLLARLRNKAAYAGEPFQAVLQIFCQEELLRRLERSRFAGNLVLKGGMFLYVATSFKSRPTVDIDFLLRSHSNEQSEVERMVAEILRIETENDFVSFDLEGVKSIPANQIYVGSQVHLIARIKNTRMPLKIDIGVGDAIVPRIEKRVVPTQLENFLSPTVLTYSFESTIAEKLHAMMQYKHMGSRMKDYYDVNYLSRTYDFQGKVLGRAVSETFRI